MTNHQNQSIEFRLFDVDYVDRMAKIRHICFPDSNITKLGYEAQKRFCNWLITGPHEVIPLGAFVNDELAGFLIAGRFSGVVSGFVKRNLRFISTRLIRNPSLLFDTAILGQILHIIRLNSFPQTISKDIVLEDISYEDSCGMLDLAVHPDYRTLGLGTELMNIGEQTALQRGFAKVQCSVLKTNPKVISFHKRHGYRIAAESPLAVKMVKSL